jgi:hypothetical protein
VTLCKFFKQLKVSPNNPWDLAFKTTGVREHNRWKMMPEGKLERDVNPQSAMITRDGGTKSQITALTPD